jgi:hypothetical protein
VRHSLRREVFEVGFVARIVRFVGRFFRFVGHQIAETIRFGGEPGGIAQSTGRGAGGVPKSVAGAMAAGAGRRVGAEANEGSITERQPD